MCSLEEKRARERQDRSKSKDTKTGKFATSGKFPEVVSKGDTRDKVAAYTGVSGRTTEKARAVVKAAGEDLLTIL